MAGDVSPFFGFDGFAVVVEVIKPYKQGRVYYQGSWWSACCEQEATLLPGEQVRVVGCRNITLLVEQYQMHS